MSELRIYPIKDQRIALEVMQAAKKNGHTVFQPSHYMMKKEEIVGAMSICSAPFVNFWMHSALATVRDSLHAIQVGENIASAKGENVLLVLCNDNSPFFPYLSRLGYTHLGQTTINSKIL